MRKQQRMRRNQIIATVIGVIIIAVFIIGLVAPDLGTSTTTLETAVPNTAAPLPTPTLMPASMNVEGQAPYVSLTGLYEVFQPAGTSWIRFQDNYAPPQNRVNVIFRGTCAVIHNFVELGVNFDSPEALSNEKFTEEYFQSEWAQYPSQRLTSKTVEDPYVIMNFDLEGRPEAPNCPSEYAGRQISWVQDGLLYNVRLVVPQNDQASLSVLQDLIVPSFVVYKNNMDIVDLGWQARYVPGGRTMIVLPPGWQSESPAGQRQVYRDPVENYRATIQQFQNAPLVSAEEAQAWLEDYRANITVLGQEAVSQTFANGYIFSYTFENADGDPFSAVISLLNTDNGTLYVADLIAPVSEINFLVTPEAPDEPTPNVLAMIRSFTVLAPQVVVEESTS